MVTYRFTSFHQMFQKERVEIHYLKHHNPVRRGIVHVDNCLSDMYVPTYYVLCYTYALIDLNLHNFITNILEASFISYNLLLFGTLGFPK